MIQNGRPGLTFTKLDRIKTSHRRADRRNSQQVGQDALILSGTLNITKENMTELRDQVKEYGLPLLLNQQGLSLWFSRN